MTPKQAASVLRVVVEAGDDRRVFRESDFAHIGLEDDELDGLLDELRRAGLIQFYPSPRSLARPTARAWISSMLSNGNRRSLYIERLLERHRKAAELRLARG